MKTFRPMTPKEFSAATGGLLSIVQVRDYCRSGRIQTVDGKRFTPYFIPFAEVERWLPVCSESFVGRFVVSTS